MKPGPEIKLNSAGVTMFSLDIEPLSTFFGGGKEKFLINLNKNHVKTTSGAPLTTTKSEKKIEKGADGIPRTD